MCPPALMAVLVALAAPMLGCEPLPREPGEYEVGYVAEYPGFYWMIEDQLAGMPRPGPVDEAADLAFLHDELGIDLLISTNLNPPAPLLVEQAGMDALHLPVEDFQAPTQLQLRQFVEAVEARLEAGERVGVHCDAGLGRTGTVMATWLVYTGSDPESAIEAVRLARPGSIESYEQEMAVRRFAWAL